MKNTQLVFDFGRLNSAEGQKEFVQTKIRLAFVDLYAQLALLGPKNSKNKSTALNAIADADTHAAAFLNSIFEVDFQEAS